MWSASFTLLQCWAGLCRSHWREEEKPAHLATNGGQRALGITMATGLLIADFTHEVSAFDKCADTHEQTHALPALIWCMSVSPSLPFFPLPPFPSSLSLPSLLPSPSLPLTPSPFLSHLPSLHLFSPFPFLSSFSLCVFSTQCSSTRVLPVLNTFLTALCVRLAELVDPRDATYTREALLSQLTHIKGT